MHRHPRSTLFPYTTLFRSLLSLGLNVGELREDVRFTRRPIEHLDRGDAADRTRHTSEHQSLTNIVCSLLLLRDVDRQTRTGALRQNNILASDQVDLGDVGP